MEQNSDSDYTQDNCVQNSYELNAFGYDTLFTVKIEDFEGPLDLLLHLVKKNELELEKISLALIANQYLECLKDIENIDIELAGEYLVIATTLVSIKSSILLNEPVELVINEDGELVNPHDLLLQQLKEAQIYKDGVDFLDKLPVYNIDIFSPKSSLKKIKNEDAPLKQHDALLLGKALKRVLMINKEARNLYHVTLESVSIADKMNFVIKFLNNKSALKQGATFTEILGESKNSLADTIATFVSLLELAKRQVIKVYQEKQKDDAHKIEKEEIMIALANGEVEINENISSEFDENDENHEEINVVNS